MRDGASGSVLLGGPGLVAVKGSSPRLRPPASRPAGWPCTARAGSLTPEEADTQLAEGKKVQCTKLRDDSFGLARSASFICSDSPNKIECLQTVVFSLIKV